VVAYIEPCSKHPFAVLVNLKSLHVYPGEDERDSRDDGCESNPKLGIECAPERYTSNRCEHVRPISPVLGQVNLLIAPALENKTKSTTAYPLIRWKIIA